MEPSPVAAIIAESVWGTCVIAFLIMRVPHLRRARQEPVHTSRRSIGDWAVRRLGEFTYAVLPLTYVLTDVLGFANYPFFSPFVAIGGLAFVAGLWCIHRALKDLGRGFSPSLEIRREHRLVTQGLYRSIRHPMYLGFLLWALAQALLLPNWIAGPAALVGWVVLFASRVEREERMMLDEFGDEYRAYMARTARLIPGLY